MFKPIYPCTLRALAAAGFFFAVRCFLRAVLATRRPSSRPGGDGAALGPRDGDACTAAGRRHL